MTSKITKYLILSLFLFTPLILSSHTSEMFEIPKMIFLYVGISTATAFFLIAVIRGEIALKINIVHVLIVIFVLSQFLSFLFSIDAHTSWYGYYGRLNGGVLSTIYFSLLLFISSQVMDPKFIRQVFLVSALSSLLVLAWGIPGRLFGADTACFYFRQEVGINCWTDEFRPAERMFATLGQPNWLGAYFATHVFFGIYVLIGSHGKLVKHSFWKQAKKFIIFAYIGLMVLGVYFTGSRSSQIALLIPLAIESLRQIAIRFGKKSAIVVVIFASVFALLIGSLYITRIYSDTNQSITHSGKIRLIVWEGALKLWEKYPVFGTGPETFAYSYFLTRPEAHNKTSEKDFVYNKAHNELLHILATTGSLGFVTYVALLAYSLYTLLSTVHTSSSRSVLRKLMMEEEPFKCSVRDGGLPTGRQGSVSTEQIWKNHVVAYAIICMTICNTLGFSTSTSQLILYFLLGIAATIPHRQLCEYRIPKIDWRLTSVLSIPVLATYIWIILFMRNYITADITFASAMSSYDSGDPAGAIRQCLEAYETKFEHVYADRCASISAGTALLLAGSDEESAKKYQASFVKMADEFGRIALTSSPKNPLYLKSRVRVLKTLLEIYPNSSKYNDELISLKKKIKLLAPTDHT